MLSLAENLKVYLATECSTVAQKMRESAQNLDDAGYYFSAAFGAVGRALNVEYSEDLCLLHMVLLNTHREVAGRAAAIRAGAEPSIGLPDHVFLRLADLTDALGARIRADADYIDVLTAMSALALASTGNGYYLMTTRGHL